MRIAIVADSFPPLKNSAAVLIFSLAKALANFKHQVLVIVPSHGIKKSYIEDDPGSFKIMRLPCGNIKSHKKFIRGISELSLFFRLPYEFKRSMYASEEWDLLIWYSPSIFLGGLVRVLKNKSKYSYLILRDIFPEWMLDIGLIRKGPSYFILKWFEKYQYQLADVIGVQSSGNLHYIESLNLSNLRELQVLPNWMPSANIKNSHFAQNVSEVNLDLTILSKKKVFIYAGNLGEAQGVENIAQFFLQLKNRADFGILIIGRGTKQNWLKNFSLDNKIQNVLFLDEVDFQTLGLYYQQSFIGLIFLDLNHRSHNIPGKFISYLEAGLPVIALVNPGNDLIEIINKNKLGLAVWNLNQLSDQFDCFIGSLNSDNEYQSRVRFFYDTHYRPENIAKQIIFTCSK